MRVNPVTSAGRANVRRKRPSVGETESERQTGFSGYLPAPEEPVLDRAQDAYVGRYRPNSIFLAHLIATRDGDIQLQQHSRDAALTGVNSYRATAALPRQRDTGHLIKTER